VPTGGTLEEGGDADIQEIADDSTTLLTVSRPSCPTRPVCSFLRSWWPSSSGAGTSSAVLRGIRHAGESGDQILVVGGGPTWLYCRSVRDPGDGSVGTRDLLRDSRPL